MIINAIDYIESKELALGEVRRRFQAGVKVVCLKHDPRIQEICDAFVSDANVGPEFWHESIFRMAQNHIAGENEFGDTLRFVPGEYGHLPRKIGFYPDSKTGQFIVFPVLRDENERLSSIKHEILEQVWSLALEVLQSAFSEPIIQTDYAVKIELLKYPNSAEHLQKLFDLIADSSGWWSRLGRKVDLAAANACGPFSQRYVKRPLYAPLSFVPGLGYCLRSLNSKFRESSYYSISPDRMIVGPPHVDTARYLTMLAGKRSVMTTEIFVDGTWIEIPVEPTALSIFPTTLYERTVGVPATVHRYTIDQAQTNLAVSMQNVTVLIGVISRQRLSGMLFNPEASNTS